MPADHKRFHRGAASPGELVPAEVAAERRHEREAAEVTRVLLRVERGDGTVREYEAVDPQSCEITTGQGTGMPTLTVHLAANVRHNLHIRTHGPWKLFSQQAYDALADFLHALGYQ